MIPFRLYEPWPSQDPMSRLRRGEPIRTLTAIITLSRIQNTRHAPKILYHTCTLNAQISAETFGSLAQPPSPPQREIFWQGTHSSQLATYSLTTCPGGIFRRNYMTSVGQIPLKTSSGGENFGQPGPLDYFLPPPSPLTTSRRQKLSGEGGWRWETI